MMYFDDDEVIEMRGKKKKLTKVTKGSSYSTNNVPVNYTYMEIEGNYSTEPLPSPKKLFSCSFFTLFLYAGAIGLFFFFYAVRQHSSTSSSDKYVDGGDNTDSSNSVDISIPDAPDVTDSTDVSNDNTQPVDTSPGYVKPNIVFILTDDQGMGDMDLTGNDLVGLMPNIKALNYAGLNLTHHYVHTQCSPSRAALLTGLYSINTGMYHSDVQGTQPWGLPLSHTLMPEYLLRAGFRSTFHLGKWHLGHYSNRHIPTARGFNFSLGYYGGYQHPLNYKYEYEEFASGNSEIPDMHLDGVKYEKTKGETADYFNSYLITDIAEAVIFQEGIVQKENQENGVEAPFFMLFAPPLISAPVMPDDSVMSNYKLSYIKNEWRRKTAGILMMLDAIVGRVVKALDTAGLTDNTIIIFASDNGAVCAGNHNGAGSNYPLRGCKGSVFEGSSRVPAFIYSPLLGHSLTTMGKQCPGVFHITDWLPTIVEGMLGRSDILPSGLDGINQFPYLLSHTDGSKVSDVAANFASPVSSTAPRSELVYNIDPYTGVSAIRVGNYKLILNETTNTGWFNSTHFGRELCGGQWITVTDPTGIPSFAPTRKPTTIVPTRVPTTRQPTISMMPTTPTRQPTNTGLPSTARPTGPTYKPTHRPTQPTVKPTTRKPTTPATEVPSVHPTLPPTNGTASPSTAAPCAPTYRPTRQPTGPTFQPSTASPSTSAPTAPTVSPTLIPSVVPSLMPSFNATARPSGPTCKPTAHPTSPTVQPTSAAPSVVPTTARPTTQPSNATAVPTTAHPTAPTVKPSRQPTTPTELPTTAAPSAVPTTPRPSVSPTNSTSRPSTFLPTAPTHKPTPLPTSPTLRPSTLTPSTRMPSAHPTAQPSNATVSPSSHQPTAPSHKPTHSPTTPTVKPSSDHPSVLTNTPSVAPIAVTTAGPTVAQSSAPSMGQTAAPSVTQSPTVAQSVAPTTPATPPPTGTKTSKPTSHPSAHPSHAPTHPTVVPTSARPSTFKPSGPTNKPFSYPTRMPVPLPSIAPTYLPSVAPNPPTRSPSFATVKSLSPSVGKPSAVPSVVTSSPTSAHPSGHDVTSAPSTPTKKSPTTTVPSIATVHSTSPSRASVHSNAPSSAATATHTTAPTEKKPPTVAPSVVAPTALPSVKPVPSVRPSAVPSVVRIPTPLPTTKKPFFMIVSKSPSHTSQPTKHKSLRERSLASATAAAAVTPTASPVYVTNSVMLFDLSTDEQERHDVSAQHPDIVASLKAELLKYKSKMSARASCDQSDAAANAVWQTAGSVEPWINLTSDQDYVCPVSEVTSVNCEWV